jgi:hypothetical protein
MEWRAENDQLVIRQPIALFCNVIVSTLPASVIVLPFCLTTRVLLLAAVAELHESADAELHRTFFLPEAAGTLALA